MSSGRLTFHVLASSESFITLTLLVRLSNVFFALKHVTDNGRNAWRNTENMNENIYVPQHILCHQSFMRMLTARALLNEKTFLLIAVSLKNAKSSFRNWIFSHAFHRNIIKMMNKCNTIINSSPDPTVCRDRILYCLNVRPMDLTGK